MADLLPSSSEAEPPEGEPRVIGVDDSDADDVIAALRSQTARSILVAIHENPATPSELADRTDTSLQNAQYHLEKLRDADLIEVIDTRYSEKGREMNVYGAADAPVVLFAGSESESRDVRSALTSLIGGLGVVALGALAVQEFVGGGIESLFGAGGAGGAAPVATTTTSESVMMAQDVNATTTATQTTATGGGTEILAAAETALGVPPGVLFFLGGVLALLVVGAIWRFSE
ncbi:MAG: ArsR/SmtB family transcription factor [Halodesulfurarchaeum sp.]